MTTPTLKQNVLADMQQAMRDGDRTRLRALRLLAAAFQKTEKDDNSAALDDAQALVVIKRLLRQYQNAVEQYRRAGQEDRLAEEEAEMQVISAYMPEPLSEEELEKMVQTAIAETGAATLRDMGKVMALVRERAQGRADMASASARVKAHLSLPNTTSA